MRANERIGSRLKVRDLQALMVLGEAGSMVRAAEVLGLSQSAMSKIVSEMEQLVGAQLLERGTRGVTLTEAGQLLAAKARIVLDELSQAVEQLRNLNDAGVGEVRIGTTEPMTNIIAEIIERLTALHPRITFVVEVSDTDSIIRGLRQRSLDIVVTRWAGSVIAEDLTAETLFVTPLAVMASKSHPLAGKTALTLRDLSSEVWALSPPDTFLGRLVAAVFSTRGVESPRPTVETVSIYTRLNLLAGGRFLSILPTTMLRHESNRNWLVALSVDLADSAGPIAAIRLRARTPSGSQAAFLAMARLVAQEIA